MKWLSRRRRTPAPPPDGARARNAGDRPDYIVPWTAIDEQFAEQLARGVGKTLTLVSSAADIPNGLPDGWGEFDDPSPQNRVAAAHELWAPLLRHMPLTREFLQNRLLDVRLIRVGDDEPGLAYAILSNEDNLIAIFVGYDPRFALEPPQLWSSVPLPLREFIEQVHSSVEIARLPHTAFPLFKPDMDMLDSMEWGIVESDEFAATGFDVPLDQMMMIHASGGGGYVCVSPPTRRKRHLLAQRRTTGSRRLLDAVRRCRPRDLRLTQCPDVTRVTRL